MLPYRELKQTKKFQKSNESDVVFGNVFACAGRKRYCILSLPCYAIAGNERNTVFTRLAEALNFLSLFKVKTVLTN